MKDAQKPDHMSLTSLVNRLRDGRFVIPDFQRDFEWLPWDIRHLMRSIFLDYYIGSLLLWRGKAESYEKLSCEPIYGFDGRGEPSHIVLDGQQRLTAIYYAFFAPDIPAPKRANRYLYFIRVDQLEAGNDEEAFIYDWTRRGINLLADREQQFARHMFPLAVIGAGGWELPNWVQDYAKFWEQREAEAQDESEAAMARRHVADARAFGERVRGIIEQYQVAYVELDQDLELEKICDIFTQINSRGVRLDIFDLMNALLRPKGLKLRQMWQEARERLAFIESDRTNIYVLQVMSILLQSYCSPRYLYFLLPGEKRQLREPDGTLRSEILVPDEEAFLRRWEEAVSAMEKAVKRLRHPHEYGAISSKFLPYVSILPAFSALLRRTEFLPSEKGLDSQRKIRHWYWASVFTNRYSGSVETTAARDFQDISAWFEDSNREPSLIGEFKARFRSLDLRREERKGTSIYNGVFNLLIINGARDLVTDQPPDYGDVDDHHIVPRDWAQGRTLQTSIDSILNRTPLTGTTNRDFIRNRIPSEYLRDLIESNGEALVRRTLESHLISPAALDILMRDPFTEADYEAFVTERQRTIQDAIEALLIKERLDLPPAMRELDERIEGVELALRRLIVAALGGEVAKLPPHVLQKMRERIAAEARRNAAHDPERAATLEGMLEFADLRELEDIIKAKATWDSFGPVFLNRADIATRFDQLARLRNAIRHSRTVDDITRKDGEAALAWFERCIKPQTAQARA